MSFKNVEQVFDHLHIGDNDYDLTARSVKLVGAADWERTDKDAIPAEDEILFCFNQGGLRIKIGDGSTALGQLTEQNFSGSSGGITVDTTLSLTSSNPIANKTVTQAMSQAFAEVDKYVDEFSAAMDETDDRLKILESVWAMTAHFHTSGFVKTASQGLYSNIIANNLANGEQVDTVAHNPKKLRLWEGDMINIFISVIGETYNYTIESRSEANFVINPYLISFKSREDIEEVFEDEKLSIKYPANGDSPAYVNIVYVLHPEQWQRKPYLKFKLGKGTIGSAAIAFSMDNIPETAEQILSGANSMDDTMTFSFKPYIEQYPDSKIYLNLVALGGDIVYDQFYFTDFIRD